MITILHGDDIASSRKLFLEEKQKIKDSFVFEGEKITLTDITQVIDGGDLFNERKIIFIESFLGKKRQSEEFKEIVRLIQKNSKNADIFFWEEKELSKSQLFLFNNPVIKVFKYPQSLFLFLDNIRPENSKSLAVLFHKVLENSETELVFYMLIRQFRLLLALFDPDFTGIDEVKRLAPWQKSKLQKQAKLFSLKQLKNSYKKLFEIDLALKTGNLNLTLEQAIDMFLINL